MSKIALAAAVVALTAAAALTMGRAEAQPLTPYPPTDAGAAPPGTTTTETMPALPLTATPATQPPPAPPHAPATPPPARTHLSISSDHLIRTIRAQKWSEPIGR